VFREIPPEFSCKRDLEGDPFPCATNLNCILLYVAPMAWELRLCSGWRGKPLPQPRVRAEPSCSGAIEVRLLLVDVFVASNKTPN
jgi:hypothetical protein